MNRNMIPVRHNAQPEPHAVDMRDLTATPASRTPLRPPTGAPNVLVVLIDDMGFGASSAFGGPCSMPTADRLSENGLRYSRFHTTAVCSPTRASLLTGRNHHNCGMGAIPEMATNAPGYNALRPDDVATLAQVLGSNGYATGAFGKMHQTPPWESTPAGPFDRWPTSEGFHEFYGFIGPETNHFSPNLTHGTTPVERTYDEDYHFSEDMVDQAISWIDTVTGLAPDKPFFCYLSYGATHAPYHVPEDWKDRYRGKFSHGWDEQRRITLERQRETGVVPATAELAPWVDGLPHWDELDADEAAVAERLMEVYAAFAEHTDAQTGRLIHALEESGQLENTLVFYILGDNGASAEGGPQGTLNEIASVNGLHRTPSDMREHLDDVGGPRSYALYPAGWALAMDTPYQWAKQVASHYGGTRNGLIVHWPAGIQGKGEIRNQWHHVIDVVPSVLEAAGLPMPDVVNGVDQRPLDGVSMGYSFNQPGAPDQHTTQYFEMFGNRGIYHEGWTCVAQHRTPWRMAEPSPRLLSEDIWELYDTTTDWTQAHDLASEYPEKVEALKQLFVIEAARNQVFPIDDRFSERMNAHLAGRQDLMAGRTSLTLKPNFPGLREDAAPNVKNRSFRVTIDIEHRAGDGVLIAQGGRFGGWSLYISEGRLTYCHNLCGLERMYIRSATDIEAGPHQVLFDFSYRGGGLGQGGLGTIMLDGMVVAEADIARTVPFFFSLDETMDIGRDRGTPVTEEYAAGELNAYSGIIHRARIDLEEPADQVPLQELQRVAMEMH